jgi:DNA-binding CsgD family transcriptional regulator
MEYSDVRDLSTFANCLRGGYLELADWLGRWDEVESLCAFDLNQRNLSPINKVGKLIILGKIRARRGVPDEVFDEALELAVDAGTSYYVVVTALALLEAAWLVGDAAGMVRERDRALAHLEGEADPWMRGAIAAWTRRCGLSPVDIAGIESPYAELVAGDWRAAADIWQEMGSPYERGLALLDSATYGSPDTDAMLEAVRIFDDLGASATVARAQAILRQCGVKSIPRGRRASTRANGFGLTRRELEVLALVKDGLTNGDIAARLFISEKTVDNHVSALLAKLGVGSRRDAARIAVDADLVAPSQS